MIKIFRMIRWWFYVLLVFLKDKNSKTHSLGVAGTSGADADRSVSLNICNHDTDFNQREWVNVLKI